MQSAWIMATAHPSAVLRVPGDAAGRRVRRAGRRPQGRRRGARLTVAPAGSAGACPAGRAAGVVAAGRPGRRARPAPPTTTQAIPPATQEKVAPATAAVAPARRSPSRGPPATTTMKTPCSRPRISSGAYTCRIVCRKTAETRSARAGDGEQRDREPERPGQPGQRHRRAPGDDRDGQRDALPADPADPARGQAAEHRADRDRGEQPADRLLAAEPGLGHLREQRARHREDHRDDVDHERHQQHRLRGDEPQPVDHRAQAGPGELVGLGRSAAAPAAGTPRTAPTVNRTASIPYAAAKPPDRAMTTPASSGPATVPTLVTVKFSVLAAGTSSPVQQPRDDRVAGRRDDREGGRLHADQRQDQGEVVQAGQRLARAGRA